MITITFSRFLSFCQMVPRVIICVLILQNGLFTGQPCSSSLEICPAPFRFQTEALALRPRWSGTDLLASAHSFILRINIAWAERYRSTGPVSRQAALPPLGVGVSKILSG